MKRHIFIIMLLIATPVKADVTNGLVGWWQLEGNGNDSADNFGATANDGTGVGTPLFSTGKFGQGLSGDNTNRHYSIGDVTYFDSDTTFTITFWIKLNVIDGFHGWLGKWNSNNGPIVYQNYTNFLWQVGSSLDAVTIAIPGANQWFHVACLNDSGTLRVYINAVRQTPTDTAGTNTNHATALLVGWNNNGGVGYLDGIIDDVRVYNRTLSAAEIWDIYQTTSQGFLPS